MFWQSSNNRHYDSSDTESSGEAGATLWSRPASSKHKRSSKSSHHHNKSSWFPQWLSPDPSSSSKRSHHSRHRKSSKSRARPSCRPKTKHGWGLLFLTILIIVYLVDFFKILYTDPLVTKATLRETLHQSTDDTGSESSTMMDVNANSSMPNRTSDIPNTLGTDVQKSENSDGTLPGIPEPNPERAPADLSNNNNLNSNNLQGGFSSATAFDNVNGGAPGVPSSVSDTSSGGSSGTSSISWDTSSGINTNVNAGDSSIGGAPGFSSSSGSVPSSMGSSQSSMMASGQQRDWRDPVAAPVSAPNTFSSSSGSSMGSGSSLSSNSFQQLQGDGNMGGASMAQTQNQAQGQGQGFVQAQDISGGGTPLEEVKHPMNRNIPDLFVPGNTGVMSIEMVKMYYRQLAKSYLSTFQNGIYRQLHFDILRRRTYALTPPGANKGIQSMLFQIIGGRVYLMDPYEVPRNSKPFYRTRINEVIWLLSKLATEGRIKNTEFLMSIHDCVQTVNQPHTYRGAHYQESNPSFTIVSCNFSNNIPFPMWEGSRNRDSGFSSWDAQMQAYAHDEVPWERKIPKAVFRGGNRPSMYFRNKSDADIHCNDVGRTRLLHLSKIDPGSLDVSIGGACGGVRHTLDRLEPRDHHRFKYILYAEGNCMWADRTRLQVFGPSLLLKQETPCGQFFEPLLKPFTHYLPTDFFFTDTIEKIKWAREHDAEARTIVRNANEFANNFLSLNGIKAYVEVLLEEYTSLLVEPDIKLETGAIDVTNKRV